MLKCQGTCDWPHLLPHSTMLRMGSIWKAANNESKCPPQTPTLSEPCHWPIDPWNTVYGDLPRGGGKVCRRPGSLMPNVSEDSIAPINLHHHIPRSPAQKDRLVQVQWSLQRPSLQPELITIGVPLLGVLCASLASPQSFYAALSTACLDPALQAFYTRQLPLQTRFVAQSQAQMQALGVRSLLPMEVLCRQQETYDAIAAMTQSTWG